MEARADEGLKALSDNSATKAYREFGMKPPELDIDHNLSLFLLVQRAISSSVAL